MVVSNAPPTTHCSEAATASAAEDQQPGQTDRVLGQWALIFADVRLGNDPNEGVAFFDHQDAIQLVLCHQLASGIDIGVGTDGHQVLRGDVFDSDGTGVLTGGENLARFAAFGLAEGDNSPPSAGSLATVAAMTVGLPNRGAPGSAKIGGVRCSAPKRWCGLRQATTGVRRLLSRTRDRQ
jgi:hypothetical protein